MPARPRISLCIPTFNRVTFLEGAVESGLRELARMPPGTVDLLVCDNASTDGTAELLARLQDAHPMLRVFRNNENLGFDRNYLRCVEEASGEFVWIIGDDDIWLPGSLARVLHELDAGADACLCLAETCDVNLKPIITFHWYLDPTPPSVWHLEDSKGLIRYFDGCAYNAGVFAFISAAIFRRSRFLSHQQILRKGVGTGYVHIWGMMSFLRHSTHLHYIPDVLIRNRICDNLEQMSDTTLFNRWMQDFRGWAQISDAIFGDDPDVHASFSRIVGRNHGGDTFLPRFRVCAPTHDDWLDAVPLLIRAGFSPLTVAAVDFGFRHRNVDRLPTPAQKPASQGFAALPFLAIEAKHIAILALGGVQNIIDGAILLAALKNKRGVSPLRIFSTPECLEILDGFEVQCVDPKRYSEDESYRESIVKDLLDFAPELAVNLDQGRGIEADDLMAAARPPGAIAYEATDRGQNAEQIKAANGGYTCLIPRDAGPGALLEALGLETIPAMLWPTPAAREEAQVILAKLGRDPARTLVVLVDHPSVLEDPTFHSALAEATADSWTFVAIGGRGVSYQSVETLLSPWMSRSVNLTGVLGLGSTAALLQLCGGFLGGTPLLQSMAKVCGCTPAPFRALTSKAEITDSTS